MKFHATAIAIALAGITGMAAAASGSSTLSPLAVSGAAIAQCVPPDDAAGSACERFDEMVRANFTAREIGMLFGNRTSYPEYRTGGIDRLQRRYNTLLQAWLAAQPGQAGALAAK